MNGLCWSIMRDGRQDSSSQAEEGRSLILSKLSGIALPMALFGLHTFILMCTGTQGDAELAGWEVNELLYNSREGLQLLGFVLYGILSWRLPHIFSGKVARIPCFAMAVLYVVSALVMQIAPYGVLLIIAVMLMAFLSGVAGGAVYEKTALLVSKRVASRRIALKKKDNRFSQNTATRVLGAVVGIGGAISVVAQYALQLTMDFGGWFIILLAICFCLLMRLLSTAAQECVEDTGTSGNETIWEGVEVRKSGSGAFQRLTGDHGTSGRTAIKGSAENSELPTNARNSTIMWRQVLCLLAVVICLFGLFPFYEVVIRESFSFAVFYQWHRLFLVVGYLIIGAAAFLGGRPIMSLVVAIVALFTAFVLAQTALLQTDSFTMALFYALFGAVIAYSGIAFLSIAPETEQPALVASASRIVNGVVTVTGGVVASLVGGWPVSAILLAALALIALTIALLVLGGFFTPQRVVSSQDERDLPEGATPTGEEKPRFEEEEPRNDSEKPAPGEDAPQTIEGNPSTNDDWITDEGQIAAVAKRYNLTRRETEVLGLVLRGYTTQQMVDELVITKSTVKFHVTNILKKTGSQTRRQLLEKLSSERSEQPGA